MYTDRIIEETEVKVQRTIIIEGVSHVFSHQAKWENQLFIVTNHNVPEEKSAENIDPNSPISVVEANTLTNVTMSDLENDNDNLWFSGNSDSDRSSGSSQAGID